MSAKRAQLSRDALRRADEMFSRLRDKNNRQKEAITRLLAMVHESVAALTEIADGDLTPGGQKECAQRALDRIGELRQVAAAGPEEEEDKD